MTEPTAVRPKTPVQPTPTMAGGWKHRAGLIGFALIGGALIFAGGTPYFDLTPANDNAIYNAILFASFWLMTRVLRRSPVLASWAGCSHALSLAAAAMAVMVIGPFNWLVTAQEGSVQQALQDKLAQFLSVVPTILLLTWAERRPWSRVYLQRGLPRRWLTFGLGSLAACAVAVSLVAVADGASASALASVAPWVLAFAALNAVMEELWFRGIFLRPYEEGMGPAGAVVVTGLVFGAGHLAATYISAAEQLLFAALVAGLGVVLAWAMRWANALWGAVLFHVGLDLVVILEFVD